MAIKTETVTIGSKQFTHTWSDAGKYVVRDGISYEEAYDPAEFGREYTEGNDLPDVTAEEAIEILTGESS